MASLSQFLANIYTMTIVFFSIVLLEIVIFVHGAASRATKRRPITTAHFLKLIDEKAPTRQYKFGLGFEPLECRVCLSHYQEGDEVRRLKCNHTFHKDCLDTWLQQDSATCPLCRNTVLPEKVVVKHRMHRMNHHYQEDYGGSGEELMFLLNALHGNFLRRFC